MTPLIDARGLSKRFAVHRGLKSAHLHAVDAIDLTIGVGESVGLVGESGCGKSTLARLIARLIDTTSGELAFAGSDIGAVPARRFATSPQRAGIQVVFQDPNDSLNPGFTVFQAVADPIRQLGQATGRAEVTDRVMQALDDVGLPREFSARYPHQLSGGQKARVGIARAIAVKPRLLVLDEPTSALDVSVQSVILRLLADLRVRHGMSYLFVSHDLNVVRLITDRIAVMYLGKIVEIGPSADVFAHPRHPYTRALIAAIPDPARRGARPPRLEGSASSPIDPDPSVCRFAGRCPAETFICRQSMPLLKAAGRDHEVACHHAEAAEDMP
ncbi:MAG: ABC transporter ATP-binding protein [Ancalomicrobiaceae bacterium]|nr:ABC transporter ATP-binding protein [Ancalomicrobiaceae bacterium]